MTTAVKERPILFSAPMIRALLDGRKTMTRRVIPHRILDKLTMYEHHLMDAVNACPYGQPGDRLVVRVSWATDRRFNKLPPSKLPKSARIWSTLDGDKPRWCGRTRVGRYLPRRFWWLMPKLEIESVRVERVKDITLADCAAEGAPPTHAADNVWDSTETFQSLWDSINKARGFGWDVNPWVWVLSFKRIQP